MIRNPKTLKIKVEYDELTIGKIKRIPGRKYHKNEGKIWTIPYKYIKRFTDMFDESEIIYEPGVNKDYEETDDYDFEPEIALLKDDMFKSFVRYIVSKELELLNENADSTITRTKIVHCLSESRDITDNEHDILIVASILYNTNIAITEDLLHDNYNILSTHTKYVYNMYWQEIYKCMRLQKSKLHKILNDADYLVTMGYISTM